MTTAHAILPALAAIIILAPAEARANELFGGLAPTTADRMVAAFSEICLDEMPDFAGSNARLDERGFGAPSDVGFRLHEHDALLALALAAEEVSPPGAPACMVMAPGIGMPETRELLQLRLQARAQELESAENEAFDLPHMIWAWSEGDRRAQLVLARDRRGHLGAVLTVLQREKG